MDIDALTDDDRKQLAKDLAAELDTGLYGNRAVLSRRQLLSLAGGSAGIAGLTALGVDPATAQSAAGQVGTSSSPEDVFAYDLDVQNGATFNGNDLTGVGSLSTEQVSVKDSLINSVAVPGNSSESLPFNHGLIVLSKISGGSETGVFILNAASDSVEKVAGSATFVTATPSSDQVGVYHDGSDYVVEDNDSTTFEIVVSYFGFLEA